MMNSFAVCRRFSLVGLDGFVLELEVLALPLRACLDSSACVTVCVLNFNYISSVTLSYLNIKLRNFCNIFLLNFIRELLLLFLLVLFLNWHGKNAWEHRQTDVWITYEQYVHGIYIYVSIWTFAHMYIYCGCDFQECK